MLHQIILLSLILCTTAKPKSGPRMSNKADDSWDFTSTAKVETLPSERQSSWDFLGNQIDLQDENNKLDDSKESNSSFKYFAPVKERRVLSSHHGSNDNESLNPPEPVEAEGKDDSGTDTDSSDSDKESSKQKTTGKRQRRPTNKTSPKRRMSKRENERIKMRRYSKFRSNSARMNAILLPPRGPPVKTVQFKYTDKGANRKCLCTCQL